MNSNTNRKSKDPVHKIWINCKFMLLLAWKQRRSLVWLCLAIAIGAVLLNLAQIFITPSIIEAIDCSVPVTRLISIISLFSGSLILLYAMNSYLSSCTLFKRIEVRLCLAAMIQDKILTMSYPNIENPDACKKMDKAIMLVNNTEAATEAIWKTLTELLINISSFAICLTLLAALQPLLIVFVVITSSVSFIMSNHVNSWGYWHRDEESEYSRKMNYLSDKSMDYTLAKDIRIFEMHKLLESVYNNTLKKLRNFAARGERIYMLGNISDAASTLLRNSVVFLFLITGVINGELSAAQFVLYFNMIGAFSNGMGGLLNCITTLYKQCLDISAVREFLDYPEPFLFDGGKSLVPDATASYQIQLRNVSFRYPEARHDTLADINLTIHAGEKLAIVGLNGAGKTTLVKLICGFLDPTQGEVLLNHTNIKEYNRRDYYRLFSAVFQDFSLLDVTIAGNITQSELKPDIELMERCVEQAGLTEKIKKLPKGYDTPLGKVCNDGVELSGGETQRLMLARALYKNAPIIVLDEPTAALDPIAEKDIYNKYNELTAGRTSLYISHRLASTRFCDRIILLADKGVKETGTHEELLAKGGKYAKLFEIQSHYYREEA